MKPKFFIPPPPPKTQLPENRSLPEIFSFNFDDPSLEKPWTLPTNDVTDYFNYGFNEELWRIYTEETKKVFEKMDVPQRHDGESAIDLDLPIEMGGFAFFLNRNFEEFHLQKLMLKNPDQYFLMNNLSEDNFYDKFIILLHAISSNNTEKYFEVIKKFNDDHGIEPMSQEAKRRSRRHQERNRDGRFFKPHGDMLAKRDHPY